MWQALIGALANKNSKDAQATNGLENAYQQGKQQIMDLRNGLEIGDDDRKSIANSINMSYGVY